MGCDGMVLVVSLTCALAAGSYRLVVGYVCISPGWTWWDSKQSRGAGHLW